MRQIIYQLMAVSLLGASLAQAYPNTVNPDRRPSFGFEMSGSQGIDVSQSLTSTTAELRRDASNHSYGFVMDLLAPLSDAWSIQAGGGISSEQTSVSEFVILPGSSEDVPTASGFLSLRGYLTQHHLFGDTPNNPDRWPSFGITGIGSGTIYHERIDILFGLLDLNPVGDVHTYGVQGDSRIPLNNHLTLLVNLLAAFESASSDETSTAAGTEIRAQTLDYGGGFRYYFVGHNLISKDHDINPDRWCSISLTAHGRAMTRGDLIVTQAGAVSNRDFQTGGYLVASEVRLPVSDYLTFRLGVGGGIQHVEVPAIPSSIGLKTHTPQINFLAGFRWYFR